MRYRVPASCLLAAAVAAGATAAPVVPSRQPQHEQMTARQAHGLLPLTAPLCEAAIRNQSVGFGDSIDIPPLVLFRELRQPFPETRWFWKEDLQKDVGTAWASPVQPAHPTIAEPRDRAPRVALICISEERREVGRYRPPGAPPGFVSELPAYEYVWEVRVVALHMLHSRQQVVATQRFTQAPEAQAAMGFGSRPPLGQLRHWLGEQFPRKQDPRGGRQR